MLNTLHSRVLVCAALVLIQATFAAAQDKSVRRARQPIRNQYIVVLAAGEDSEVMALQAATLHRGRVRHIYRRALRGFAMRMTAADAQALAQDPRVAYVEEDGIMSVDTAQALPPWGLDRIDQRPRTLDSTYNYAPPKVPVFVHVLDTGIRASHAEFGGRAFIAGDFVDDDGDNDPADWNDDDVTPGVPDGTDCHGHGTHVAGTIGGA
jgi:hypothetical protein